MQPINKDTFMGKWNEIKGEIRKKWGQLTDDDFEKAKGDLTAIGGIIQQRYGVAKEEVRSKLDEITSRFKDKIQDRDVEVNRGSDLDADTDGEEQRDQINRNERERSA